MTPLFFFTSRCRGGIRTSENFTLFFFHNHARVSVYTIYPRVECRVTKKGGEVSGRVCLPCELNHSSICGNENKSKRYKNGRVSKKSVHEIVTRHTMGVVSKEGEVGTERKKSIGCPRPFWPCSIEPSPRDPYGPSSAAANQASPWHGPYRACASADRPWADLRG